jgi:acyl-CoA hydrolase
MTTSYRNAEHLVDDLLARVGKTIVLGLPIGLGKSIHVANALFERAIDDREISLSIFTGLILAPPEPSRGIEARLMEPIVERLYGSWPRQLYADAMQRGELPPNIEIREFYLRPGAFLDNPLVQQNYSSINYSRVVAELLQLGVNVIGQLVAPAPQTPGKYSLSCNPEVTLDLLPHFAAARRAGHPVAMIGQVNASLPYMPGAAELDASDFDYLLENPELDFPLFGLPNRRVRDTDYATGMHVASLVPDGATLQLGIGSLSDAVAHCLRMRQQQPDVFAAVLRQLPGGSSDASRHTLPVEVAPFEQGLYSCTEFMSDGILALLQSGVIRRDADDSDDTLIHAGFFIGSENFYASLKAMPDEQRRRLHMSPISFVNTLDGDQLLKRRQRRKGRFINETMMATLLGAAVSDALDDGRVVSGVGGQFDFVNMAAALDDAHSILMLPATRRSAGTVRSNIRWNYAHTTIPRQHRDIFVTEYGLAVTRGKTDAQTIVAMLRITDARFQQELLQKARAAKKVRSNFELDDGCADNTQENIAHVFAAAGVRDYFPDYPFGSDLTLEEQQLAVALPWLAESSAGPWRKVRTVLRALASKDRTAHRAALERMQLLNVNGVADRVLQKLVNLALTETGKDDGK